ncbi:hypothetical protein RchiOBHm_Chr6g0274061 [Rosa chinensis]|uniref:Uncharacterized protein n=1 Tax=Rosa chinensis TaxID=74649 RepID=A0A2P6PRM8_ROSCH|nr:hypothetical protein RchiOBHm_Chr6g0274061 [Rosa chinensis]
MKLLLEVSPWLKFLFPLPNPQDPFSLKPGSISANVDQSRTSEAGRSLSLNAAIAGARAAAKQFSKKAQTFPTTSVNDAAKSVTVPIIFLEEP